MMKLNPLTKKKLTALSLLNEGISLLFIEPMSVALADGRSLN